MSVETNKETVRRFIDEVVNQHQLQAASALATPDDLNRDPNGLALPEAAQNLTGYRAAFPDMHLTITQMLGEGDLVAVQWTATGTHQQPITHVTEEFARPPTGKTMSMTGFSLVRFSGDKIAEIWNHWDTHHLLRQLSGAVGEWEQCHGDLCSSFL